jgi:hypothetical protein
MNALTGCILLSMVNKRLLIGFSAAGLALALSACQQQDAPPPVPFTLSADIQQSMLWILEPAADVIWDSAGFVIDESGETDLSPTSEDGWNKVLYAAATLSESGNLLMLPGRSAGDDWNEYARGLVEAGKRARDAAEARDAEALFDAGGQVYQVCRACHNQYWRKGESDG